MNTTKSSGRPKVKDKVKVRSAYLKDSENAWVVKTHGSITKAIREKVLPKNLK